MLKADIKKGESKNTALARLSGAEKFKDHTLGIKDEKEENIGRKKVNGVNCLHQRINIAQAGRNTLDLTS